MTGKMNHLQGPRPLPKGTLAREWFWPAAIVILALAVRWLAVAQTTIINPDGPLYIHQARAIWYGNWSAIGACSSGIIILPLTNFPFFIAGAFGLVGDWLLAARLVGIVFGGLAVLPIWLLARRLLPLTAACLAAVAFALMPTLVEMSAEVVRGSVFFFFLAWGLWLLIRALDYSGHRRAWSLIAASMVLSLAVWSRAEGLVYLVGGGLFLLLFNGPDRRWRDLACLALPAALLAGVGLILLNSLLQQSGTGPGLEPGGVVNLLTTPIRAYDALVQALDALRQTSPAGIPSEFLILTRDYIWIIGLASTIQLLFEGLWYPFALLALVGLPGFWRKVRQDRRLACLALIGLLSLLGVYVGLLTTWWPTRRYWAVTLLPWLPWLGLGAQKLLNWLKGKGLKPGLAMALAVVAALAVTLPRNAATREGDKELFKEIGRSIAITAAQNRPVGITSARESTALWWTIFYANLKFKGAPCPRPLIPNTRVRPGQSPWAVTQSHLDQGIGFYLMLESQVQPPWFTLSARTPGCLTEAGRWNHPDTGEVILYRFNPAP